MAEGGTLTETNNINGWTVVGRVGALYRVECPGCGAARTSHRCHLTRTHRCRACYDASRSHAPGAVVNGWTIVSRSGLVYTARCPLCLSERPRPLTDPFQASRCDLCCRRSVLVLDVYEWLHEWEHGWVSSSMWAAWYGRARHAHQRKWERLKALLQSRGVPHERRTEHQTGQQVHIRLTPAARAWLAEHDPDQ